MRIELPQRMKIQFFWLPKTQNSVNEKVGRPNYTGSQPQNPLRPDLEIFKTKKEGRNVQTDGGRRQTAYLLDVDTVSTSLNTQQPS